MAPNPTAAWCCPATPYRNGTTPQGGDGAAPYGTIFKVNTDGTGFTNLHNFNGPDGQQPHGWFDFIRQHPLRGPPRSAARAAAVTASCSPSRPTGPGFTQLLQFQRQQQRRRAPNGGLVLSGNTLCGTAGVGGPGGVGGVSPRKRKHGRDGFHQSVQLHQRQLRQCPKRRRTGWRPGIVRQQPLRNLAMAAARRTMETLFAINTDSSGSSPIWSPSAMAPAEAIHMGKFGPGGQYSLWDDVVRRQRRRRHRIRLDGARAGCSARRDSARHPAGRRHRRFELDERGLFTPGGARGFRHLHKCAGCDESVHQFHQQFAAVFSAAGKLAFFPKPPVHKSRNKTFIGSRTSQRKSPIFPPPVFPHKFPRKIRAGWRDSRIKTVMNCAALTVVGVL